MKMITVFVDLLTAIRVGAANSSIKWIGQIAVKSGSVAKVCNTMTPTANRYSEFRI